jgi:prolyl 4-hydroxylase
MNQIITPELRQWIIEQATAGFTPDAVVRAMQDSGWEEDVAVHAMEVTLQDMLKERSAGKQLTGAPLAGHASSAAVPLVDLAGSPRQLDLGDRRVDVLASFRLPRAVLLGGLLSDEECDALVDAARPRMARSLTVQR